MICWERALHWVPVQAPMFSSGALAESWRRKSSFRCHVAWTQRCERPDLAAQSRMKPVGGVGFGLGLAPLVVLFPKAREFVPVKPRPACPQAVEKFEFAAGKY